MVWPYHLQSNCHDGLSEKQIEEFKEQRETGFLSDGVISIFTRQFRIHRALVCSASGYLNEKYENEDIHDIYIIHPDVDGDVFETVLRWIYTGQCELHSLENTLEVLTCSKFLEIDGLSEQCSDVIMETVPDDALLKVRKFSMQNYPKLEEYCKRKILTKFQELFQVHSDQFMNLPYVDLMYFCTHDRVNASEELLWSCIERWVEHDLPSRQEFFPNLFQSIRLPLIDKDFFRTNIKSHRFVYGYRECNKNAKNTEHIFDLFEEAISQRVPIDPMFLQMKDIQVQTPRIPGTLVIVLGGRELPGFWSCQMHAYDPRADRWKIIVPDNMNDAGTDRAYHGCTMIDEKNAVIAGGYTEQGLFLNKVGIIDLEKLQYHEKAPMNNVRRCFSCTAMNGKVYALGGLDGTLAGNREPKCECYDLKTNQWTVMRSYNVSRQRCCAAVVKGKLYVTGGYTWPYSGELASIERYDEENDRWELWGELQTGRYDASCCEWNGKLVVAGGESSGWLLSNVEVFDPDKKTTELLAPMRKARSCFGIVPVNGGLLAIGGMQDDGYRTSTVEFYDPKTKEWSFRANMNDPLSDHGVLTLSTRVLELDVLDIYLTQHREECIFEKWEHERLQTIMRNESEEVEDLDATFLMN